MPGVWASNTAGGHDISFRLDGGGGVVRDIRGHVDSIILSPGQAPTPCTVTYDGLLEDTATTLIAGPGLTELMFGNSAGPNGPTITGGTTTNGVTLDVPTGLIKGTLVHGNLPGCAYGGAGFTASLVAPEAPPGPPVATKRPRHHDVTLRHCNRSDWIVTAGSAGAGTSYVVEMLPTSLARSHPDIRKIWRDLRVGVRGVSASLGRIPLFDRG